MITFVAVFLIARAFGVAGINALMLASLAMATSPATMVRVINEQRSSGQVTERALHLCALNCVLAVFAFNASVGLWIFRTSEDVGDASRGPGGTARPAGRPPVGEWTAAP